MAQASSVPAREPSMEEILASIRRIIEDSDTGQPPADASAAQPAVESPAPEYTPAAAEVEAPAESAEEVEAFRTELSAMEQEAELQQAPVAVEPLQPVPDIDRRPPFVAAPEPASLEEESAGSAASDAQPEPMLAPPKAARVPEQPAAAYDSGADHHAPARSSILSEQAGRQVAAAFEELSDAFASTQQRSFDDVAEELMRPMLQDWLDNNLPLLVERLVREEIERVARGAAR